MATAATTGEVVQTRLRRGGTIALFATGIARSDGGIASANRNVQVALERLAAAAGAQLNVFILHEPGGRSRSVRPDGTRVREHAYGGRKGAMARDIAASLLRARLVVFDHVHIATPLAFLAPVPRLLRAKTVVFAHGSESWKRIKPVSVRAFRAADLTLTNSNYTLRHMRGTFDGFRGIACPLGLPPQFALTREPPERTETRPLITAADGTRRPLGPRAMLLVGRMDAGEREKGHRELITVLPQVCAAVPDAELVFVGSGSDLAALKTLAVASSAAANIVLPGRVDDATLTALYKAAYAYIMPSRQEGFGLVYLEAMNQALPCLACRDDGAGDVVVDGDTGILLDQPIDLDELTVALVALLSDPERARALGLAGWHRLNEAFTAAAHQERIAALLEPMLA